MEASFIVPILDLLPDAIIWVKPVFDKEGSICDFEVGYSNKQADEGINHPKGSLTGLRILQDGVPARDNAEKNFQHFLDVYQTGEQKEYAFYATHGKRYYETLRRVYADGVLSATRDRKAQREAEQKELETRKTMQSIVDSSPNGIVVYEAVRDVQGTITDFKLKHYNERCNQLTGHTRQEREEMTLRQILQSLNAEAFFDNYVAVVHTGVSFQREQFIEKGQKWISSSMVKLGDGFLSMLTDITALKKSQESLEHESHFSNSILNASLNGIYVLEAVRDLSGNISDFVFLRSNQRFSELTGILAEEVKGKSLLNLFPHSKETGLFPQLCRVINTNLPQGQETYYSETLRRWYDYMAVKLDENRVVVTFQEITRQREAALLLAHQKNMLDNILAHSSNGISVGEMIRDDQGNIVDFRTIIANEAAIRYTGIPKSDYLSKTASELDPHFIGSAYFHQCVACMETGTPFLTQYYMEGVESWLEVSVSKMDEEHQIYIFTDVTSVKKAQLSLERSALQLQTIINRTQSGIFTLAPVTDDRGRLTDFRFVIVNRTLAAYVHQEPEAMTGELGSTWFSGYKNNGLFERFRNTYESGDMSRFDFHYHADGIDAWLDMMCTRFDGELLVTFTDYTPIKQLQLELQKLVEELKQSNESLEEFAYAASHDLQEPLRKIHTFSDRLKQELSTSLTAGQQQMFVRIESATQRMRHLIDDLLSFSEVSKKQVAYNPVNLQEVVETVLQDLETSITETGATLTLPQLPEIKGDARQLRQLFQNLLGNAIKYRKPGVAPVVTINCKLLTEIDAAPGPFLEIEITDNGIGFEPEYAETIFQVFQRLHGRQEYEGTGIGLAIVHRVVKNHNGFISAEGRPGQGATFRVLLPA